MQAPCRLFQLLGRRRLYGTNSSKRLYTREHEWLERREDGRLRLGITNYAQQSLGDLVYVELPKVGTHLQKQQVVGVVESVKGASDVYAPVSGKVQSINAAVIEKPSLINKSPEDNGWLCEVEPLDPQELTDLLDEPGYNAFCKGQRTVP